MRHLLFVLHVLSFVLAGTHVEAVTRTWVHPAINNNLFSKNTNWEPSGPLTATEPGDDLVFGADTSVNPNMNEDPKTSTNYSSVTFTNGGFTIRTANDGRLMRLKAGGGITNQAGFVNGDNQIGPHVVMLGALTLVNHNTYSELVFIPDDKTAEKYTIDGQNHALVCEGPGKIVIGSTALNLGEMRNIGSLTKRGVGSLELWGTNTWNGGCDVEGGLLRLSTVNRLGSSISVAYGATLAAAISYPGTTLEAQSLIMGGSGSGSTNTFELGAWGTPVADVISVSNLTLNGTTYVNVTGWGLRPGQFVLIRYQELIGNGTNFVLNSFPAGVTAYLSNNIANKSVDIVIPAPVSPAQADPFVDSISICTHVAFSHDPTFAVYVFTNTVTAVKHLGIRHIRDGFGDWNNDLGTNGIHLQVPIGGCYSWQIDGFVADLLASANRLNPGVLDWIEGVNEPNIFDSFMSAQDVFDLQAALWTAFKNDPNQRHVPILMPSLARGGNGVGYVDGQHLARQLGALGIQRYADYANAHSYPDSFHMPEGLHAITESFGLSQASAPDLPTIVSETQYCTPPNQHGIDEWAAGIYTPRLLLELKERGVRQISLYELFDLPNEGGNFSYAGLYHSDGTNVGTIKPQGLAVRNMIGLLSDPGQSFQVIPLHISVSGGELLRSKLFQKRNGEYWLALWRMVDVGYWDGSRFVDSYPLAQDVTLTFEGGFVPSEVTSYTDLANEVITAATVAPAITTIVPAVGGQVKFVKITGSHCPESIATVLYTPRFDGEGRIVLSGTNIAGKAGGTYSLLSATNVNAPLSAWTTNVSDFFGDGGSFSNTIALEPSDAQRFFRIKTP